VHWSDPSLVSFGVHTKHPFGKTSSVNLRHISARRHTSIAEVAFVYTAKCDSITVSEYEEDHRCAQLWHSTGVAHTPERGAELKVYSRGKDVPDSSV